MFGMRIVSRANFIELCNLLTREDEQAFKQLWTRLGLSVSHSIVKAHGGRIQARNNSHGGATFAVSLPIGDPPAAARIAA